MIEKGQIKNGVPDGINEKFQIFYINGNIMGGYDVVQGLLNGTFKKYDSLGNIPKEIIFEIKIETAFPADCDYILEALKSEIQKVKNDDEEKYENLFF
ncbi:hypothetical protein LIY46_09930 [Fusobacterium varium]|uniref:hypothetical protein n=1 Tax=Fusobacterium TaxID=848 RepID=UPI0015A200C6